MPTREQIEEAQRKCIEKWEFMASVCNGSRDYRYYTELWISSSGVKGTEGCAYCNMFDCETCPLTKMNNPCLNPGAYLDWHYKPTRENALAMLEVIKHSLDNYFDEELPEKKKYCCAMFKRCIDEKVIEWWMKEGETEKYILEMGYGIINYCPYCGKKL